MKKQAKPRDTKMPEPRPALDDSTIRKDPPKPVIRQIYADWAMI